MEDVSIMMRVVASLLGVTILALIKHGYTGQKLAQSANEQTQTALDKYDGISSCMADIGSNIEKANDKSLEVFRRQSEKINATNLKFHAASERLLDQNAQKLVVLMQQSEENRKIHMNKENLCAWSDTSKVDSFVNHISTVSKDKMKG